MSNMTTKPYSHAQDLYHPPTVPGIFMHQALRFGDRVLKMHKRNGAWVSITWHDCYLGLRQTSMGLFALGLRKGDRVGIVSRTRSEWSDSDLAILTAGGIVVGIYPSASVQELMHIVAHSGCQILFIENDKLLDTFLTIREENLLPTKMILFDTERSPLPEGVLTIEGLKRLGGELDLREPDRFESSWRAVKPDDLATIAYTSGTSGPPKGAMITHANLYHTAINAIATQNIEQGDVGIAYLPLTHMLQRLTVYSVLHAGSFGAYAESIEKLLDNCREIHPTIQVGVPRVFEKIHSRIMERIYEGSPLRRWIFTHSISVGNRASQYKKTGRPLPFPLNFQHALADRFVFRKIRYLFGNRIRLLISGGAPLSLELLEFFYAAGLLILEGYGLTETVAPVSVNRPDGFKFGSVGQLIDGIEARLDQQSELLLRGRGLFRGYYRDPQATEEAIDPEGWFHTGDIAKIDDDGFIWITDRKKDIIITAGGKNIAPQNIENNIKIFPCVNHVMVHGDRQKYLTALITLDEAEIAAFAAREGITCASSAELTSHPRVRMLVEAHMAAVNARLAPHETIRHFRILPHDFTEAAGELTPTLKIRRKEIIRKYRAYLDEMYQ